MGDEEKRPSGCGLLMLYNTLFHRPPPTPYRAPTNSSSSQTSPDPVSSSTNSPKLSHSNSRRRRGATLPDDTANSSPKNNPNNFPKYVATPPIANSRHNQMPSHARTRASNTNSSKVSSGGGISTDLDNMLHDYQRTKGSSTLVRASSGNVMLYGNLGNLRAPGAVTPSRNVLDHLPKTAKEMNRSYGNNNGLISNVAENDGVEVPGVMCRALSRRVDSEELKEMGNEDYKNGNFAEAVALYDQAILMDPEKAAYWSNKAAALTAMGKLLEAVSECREAVRIDPNYYRAHHRLGTLYLRLGEADRALHQYKLSRNEVSSSDISRAQALQSHFSKCREARRLKDWHSVLKEVEFAFSSGADSSPQVFAFKAEALLMLCKHEEAEKVIDSAPKFDMDESTKFFGAMKNAFFLMIRAQVDMAAGKFDDALNVANKAARLDTSSKESGSIAKKARLVASSRANGNDLFKASKFQEACVAYGEGLNHDANNAILLCNRAACLSKLGQCEKAVEDCNAALDLRPSYAKARLRRADCYAKLERWKDAIDDYEVLLEENPENENIVDALNEARAQFEKRQHDGSDVRNHASDLVIITTMDQFRHMIMSPRLSLVLLFDKFSDISKNASLMEQLCKQYPHINFLKVNIQEISGFAKSERVQAVPSFRIYKNGSVVREFESSEHDKLENYMKTCST